jgi:formylglycine-generating enzyme required for sulfatase activity
MIGRTELPWDAYDAFMLSPPSAAQGAPAVGRRASDAVARPSRPYGAPDYGWGHRGFPTISVAREGAEAFCAWLSMRTGMRYRLPTEAEWTHVAALARGTSSIDSLAWHAGNSGGRTHAAGTRAPDALGLYDLFGNAAEWVTTADGQRVTRGGSYRDAPNAVGPAARAIQDDSWNERDPQIPKSRWWLSDAPFVGFRIVRELP